MLVLILAAQPLGYKVLTEARYQGQNLTTIYFRLSTMSDLLSLGFVMLATAFIIAMITRPGRISLSRTIAALIFTGIVLWLDFGLRRMEPSEFLPEAGIALILSMCGILAVFSTRSRSSLKLRNRVIQICRNAIAIFIGLAFLAFAYSFFYPSYSGLQEITNFNADAGVVLGAAVWRGHGLGDRPSPALRERIDVGYDLLTKQEVPRLVVTGASAPGELAEAEVARKELLARGADPSQVIEETASHTTLEQVRYIHDELLVKQNWRRFVIISDQYHLARVCEMAKFNGLRVIGTPSRIHQPFLDLLYYRARESVALVEYWMLGR
jgi:uncharacterized SAM-binding protein YcdF (DUF218 family)